jgi:hypothetical protein
MIRCTKCGTLNEAGTSFCSECSSYLEWSSEKVDDAAAPGGHSEPDSPAGPDVSKPTANAQPMQPPSAPTGMPPPAPAAAGTSPTAATPVARTPTSTPQPPSRRPAKGSVAAAPKPRQAQPVKAKRPLPGERACANCGSGNDPQRKFCRRCGQSLAIVPIEQAQPKAPWYRRFRRGKQPAVYDAGMRPDPRGARRSWRPGFVSLILGFLVVLGIGGGAAYVSVPSVGEFVDDGIRAITDRVEGRTLAVPVSSGPSAADHPADHAVDRNLATWWLGPRGQKERWVLDLDFERAVDVRSVNIHGGANGDEDLEHGRPRSVRIRAGDDISDIFTLEDIATVQAIAVDFQGIESLRFIVIDTYRGSSSANDVAIRELEFEVSK